MVGGPGGQSVVLIETGPWALAMWAPPYHAIYGCPALSIPALPLLA